MTINALFGTSTNRESRARDSTQRNSTDSAFATTLANLTRDSEQAPTGAADQTNAGSSEILNSAATAGGSQSTSAREALGADADAMATGAADGITITVQPVGSLDLLWKMDPSQGTSANVSNQSNSDTLSQSTFDSLVKQFGGNQAQADQLFSLLGGSDTGTVSNAQMLNALGHTQSDPTSQTSQMLMTLMDKNGNQIVSGDEFTQFETAMVDAERGSVA